VTYDAPPQHRRPRSAFRAPRHRDPSSSSDPTRDSRVPPSRGGRSAGSAQRAYPRRALELRAGRLICRPSGRAVDAGVDVSPRRAGYTNQSTPTSSSHRSSTPTRFASRETGAYLSAKAIVRRDANRVRPADRKVYCDRSDTRRRELKAIRDMRAVRAMRGSGRRGRDVEALVSVRDQVFGAHDAGLAKALLLPSLTRRPGAAAAVVVWAGQIPIAGARVEFTMAATSPACRAAARCRPGAGVVCSAPWWPIGLSRVGEGLPLSPGRRCPRLPTDPSGHWGSSCLPLRPRPRIQAEQADVAVAVPDRTRRTAAGGDYLRWRAGGWSADPRPFPDDPKVVRLRLKPIHGCGDVALWRCCRPPLAYALDLAAALQVLRAGERVVAVEACRAGGHRRRE